MFKKNISFLLSLLVYINFVNIVFGLVRLSGLVTLRPIISYDYFLIAIFIVLRISPYITWIYFILCLLFDLLTQVSATYLFSPSEFVKSFQFSPLYQFTTTHYFILVISIIYLYLNLFLIKKFSQSNAKLFSPIPLAFFIGIMIALYGIDYLNGGSSFNNKKIISITQSNLAGSSIKDIGRIAIDLTRVTPKPQPTSLSLTFDSFETDSTGNQLLIILESWGFPNDSADWKILKEGISKMAIDAEWNIDAGSTPFKGGTTHAELRELLKVEGNYRYFLDKDSAGRIKSIFNVKKSQGYYTVAAHSFSAKMFERLVWWKNIGIDTTFFLEDGLNRKEVFDTSLNYSTPFPSLNDEDAFSFLNTPVSVSKKKFAYLLTENSHLPIYEDFSNRKIQGMITFESQISAEANNQLIRIQELLFFFINKIDKNRWSKVLIVGDHIPPFSREADRNFYSDKTVPYLLLSRH